MFAIIVGDKQPLKGASPCVAMRCDAMHCVALLCVALRCVNALERLLQLRAWAALRGRLEGQALALPCLALPCLAKMQRLAFTLVYLRGWEAQRERLGETPWCSIYCVCLRA